MCLSESIWAEFHTRTLRGADVKLSVILFKLCAQEHLCWIAGSQPSPHTTLDSLFSMESCTLDKGGY